ncbi:flagellar basal body-associated FliL family protein [Minwuia sp.]|uniref:flagellar basal body-associated FliL family protein n=1 Tax=Minwuia sp. TaxID=2493630 RepID=UPI003A91DE2E
MAEEETVPEAEGEATEQPKKKLSGKVLVLFVALPLLLIGGGGAAFFMMSGGGDGSAQAAAAASDDHGKDSGDGDSHASEKKADDDGHGGGKDDGHGGGGGDHGGGDPALVGTVKYAGSDLIFFELPDMLVNLNTSGSQPRFLKIKVALEFGDEEIVGKVRRIMPRIIDHFQVYLRELRREDLRGSAGMYRLKEELMIRVNQSVQPSRIRDVLFKEMLVQ